MKIVKGVLTKGKTLMKKHGAEEAGEKKQEGYRIEKGEMVKGDLKRGKTLFKK